MEKHIINNEVDYHSTRLFHKLGFRKPNWVLFLKVLIGILMVLNAASSFARPDFVTLVVIVLSLHYLSDAENINRDQFRLLPLLLFISIIYDFLWLFFIQDLRGEGEREHGGIEKHVKIFSLRVTYIEFIYKFPFLLVLWKVSYNYLLDIRQVKEAPRIAKLIKIINMVQPKDDDEEQRYQNN